MATETSAQLTTIAARLEDVLQSSAGLRVAGAVAAVAIGDEEVAVAHGTANLNTGEPFTPDTGFLLGSVTKVMVTTVLMRLVERGYLDLDERVARYVPEFTLRDAGAAERITVRMLVNHTNGIDADGLGPSPVRGRDAARSYTAVLAERDVLFEPGAFVHYSNPGFVLAGRIMEEATGLPFERAIAQELFEPCGLRDATALQTQAFLRRTAIGAFADSETSGLRPTEMFTLAESMGGAGSTLIVSPQDMLAFGRMHLNGGVAPNGERVLSADSVAAMQTTTFDTGLPQAPPIGLGWWLFPIAGTTAPWHGGGSPGGASSFCIVPEHGAVIVSFASGTGAAGEAALMNDRLHIAVLEELTGEPVTPPFAPRPTPPGDEVAGEYASFQVRTRVERDGNDLAVTTVDEPYDEDHAEKAVGYGSNLKPKRVTYSSVAPGQFTPAGVDHSTLGGFYRRASLLATLPARSSRRAGLHQMLRYLPKLG